MENQRPECPGPSPPPGPGVVLLPAQEPPPECPPPPVITLTDVSLPPLAGGALRATHRDKWAAISLSRCWRLLVPQVTEHPKGRGAYGKKGRARNHCPVQSPRIKPCHYWQWGDVRKWGRAQLTLQSLPWRLIACFPPGKCGMHARGRVNIGTGMGGPASEALWPHNHPRAPHLRPPNLPTSGSIALRQALGPKREVP